MILYDPGNWYWIVAGDESWVYSSAAAAYVAPTDEAYSAWIGSGAQPTRILSEEELSAVLVECGLPFAPQTVAVARIQQFAAAAAAYDVRRQTAMAWDFGATDSKDDAGTSHGPAGIQALQMRDTAANDDLKNWIAVAALASVLAVGGHGSTILPLKTAGNVWVQTTAAQVLQVMATGDGTQTPAFSRGLAMLAHYGALKKQIADATDTASIFAIDLSAGWPA